MATISEGERLRRRASNEDVLGSHALEGLAPDAETLSLLSQFEAGELDREQLSAAIDLHVQRLLASQRSLAGVA